MLKEKLNDPYNNVCASCFTKDRFSSILPNVQRVLHTAQGELNRLQIKHGKGLKLKPMEILSSRVAQTDKLGETQHWSANGFFTHLSLLERLVSKGVRPILLQLILFP